MVVDEDGERTNMGMEILRVTTHTGYRCDKKGWKDDAKQATSWKGGDTAHV